MLLGLHRKILFNCVIDMLEKKELLFINKNIADKQGTYLMIVVILNLLIGQWLKCDLDSLIAQEKLTRKLLEGENGTKMGIKQSSG